MTTAVSSNPYASYANLLQPAQASASTNASLLPLLNGVGSDNAAAALLANPSLNTSTPGGLDTGIPQLSANVVALLQQLLPGASSDTASLLSNIGNSSDSLSSLLGDSVSDSAADALTLQTSDTLSAAAYAQALGAAFQGSASATNPLSGTSPVEAVLANYQAASNAYNTAALQSAAQVLAANSYGADGALLV